MQYNFIYGSYKDYREAKNIYVKEAVENFHLLKYVNNPITINNVNIFSKMGRNMIKNTLLDKFRIETKDEKMLKKLAKEEMSKKELHKTLGVLS